MEIYTLTLKNSHNGIPGGTIIKVPGEGSWNTNFIVQALRKKGFNEEDIRGIATTALWEQSGKSANQDEAVALQNELQRYSMPTSSSSSDDKVSSSGTSGSKGGSGKMGFLKFIGAVALKVATEGGTKGKTSSYFARANNNRVSTKKTLAPVTGGSSMSSLGLGNGEVKRKLSFPKPGTAKPKSSTSVRRSSSSSTKTKASISSTSGIGKSSSKRTTTHTSSSKSKTSISKSKPKGGLGLGGKRKGK